MLDLIKIPNPFYLLASCATYYLVNFAVFRTFLREYWIDYAHFTEAQLEEYEKHEKVPKTLGTILSIFVTTTVLWSLLLFFEAKCWCDAATLAFYLWLGFTATNQLNTFLWEPTKFYVLCYNWGYRLASLASQAIVLNWMKNHDW